MSLLVGQDRVQVLAVHGLVYTHVPANVLRQQNPITCMFELVPIAEAAEMLLVGTFQIVAVNL